MSDEEFLIEVGVEELPAIPFLKEESNLLSKWESIFQKNGFDSKFELFYTPRRITLYSKAFKPKANDEEQEIWGPPVSVALKDGEKTKAFESFLTKNALTQEEISFCVKDGKECLYAKKYIEGKHIANSLESMLIEWLGSLHFGKSMRWGSLNESFIRPIRWILALLGSNALSVGAYGATSSNISYGHRQNSFEPIFIINATDYFEKIASAGVMLDASQREIKILDDIKSIESSRGLSVEIDKELLAEVTAITEYPSALLGEFDPAFLKVPSEVIIASMKENQRYFPVFEGGSLSNHFVVVSNAFIDDFDKVIAGNERVLKARLSDALFFYENDLKNGLSCEALKNIVFAEGLGSVADKVDRESSIASYLADTLSLSKADKENLLEAAQYSKADLTTEVVCEFGELQGVMGRYYAKAAGMSDAVAEAIMEQYMPKGEDGELPKTLIGALLSIAVKLDSLMALFSVGTTPSGSKDPYALRRSAIGVIKNLLHFSINLSLSKTLKELSGLYKPFDYEKTQNFILDRLYQIFYDVNPSIVSAVLASGDKDPLSIAEKIEALNFFVKKPEFKEWFSTFKRVANISKDVDLSKDLPVNEEFFENDYEAKLWAAYLHGAKDGGSYHETLSALFGLKKQLDDFFDNCMVNAEDANIRANRKNMAASVYKRFLSIADIKEIGF